MRHDFCTLTDKNYVYKWLALCHSIDIHMPDSKIWVLCLDDESYDLIRKLHRKNTEALRLCDLKDDRLEKLRATRTKQEFAWTCKPAIMSFLLDEKNVNDLLFVDADLYFYSSVDPLFRKYKDASILITSHKFPKHKEYLALIVGYYNSGFIIFRNDKTSRACAKKYKEQCIEWCYNYHDNGRHGDQSYLKTWPQEFKKVVEVTEKGVNLGTWNLERYHVTEKNNRFLIDREALVCFHFHGLLAYVQKDAHIKLYPLTIHHTEIYDTYLQALQASYDEILLIDPSWKYGFAKKLSLLRFIKQYITRIIRNLCLHTR